MASQSFSRTTRVLRALLDAEYLDQDAKRDVRFMLRLHESREYRMDRYSSSILAYPFLVNPASPAGTILRSILNGYTGDLFDALALTESREYGHQYARSTPYILATGAIRRAAKYLGHPLSSGDLLTAAMIYPMDPAEAPLDADREQEIYRRLAAKIPLTSDDISRADSEIASFLLDRSIDPNGVAMRLRGYGGVPDDADNVASRYSVAIVIEQSGRLRVQVLDRWGQHRITDSDRAPVAAHGLWLPELVLFLREEIEVFEALVNQEPPAPEEAYQEFFEAHPKWLFMLGEQYETAKSQVRLPPLIMRPELAFMRAPVDDMWLKPDFVLKRIGLEMWDVLDIKASDQRMVVGRRSRRKFSAAIADAVAQLREYRRRMIHDDVRTYLRKQLLITVVEPVSMIVVGRDQQFKTFGEKAAFDGDRSVRIYTYDDLLRLARHRVIGLQES
jgi:hypothetical protein